jgi:hypothetical protein
MRDDVRVLSLMSRDLKRATLLYTSSPIIYLAFRQSRVLLADRKALSSTPEVDEP